MKIYRDSIFSSNDPAPTPAEPSPAPKVERSTDEMVSSAREILKQSKPKAEPERDAHATYRHLQLTDPAAAGKYWRENKDEIYRLAIKRPQK